VKKLFTDDVTVAVEDYFKVLSQWFPWQGGVERRRTKKKISINPSHEIRSSGWNRTQNFIVGCRIANFSTENFREIYWSLK